MFGNLLLLSIRLRRCVVVEVYNSRVAAASQSNNILANFWFHKAREVKKRIKSKISLPERKLRNHNVNPSSLFFCCCYKIYKIVL